MRAKVTEGGVRGRRRGERIDEVRACGWGAWQELREEEKRERGDEAGMEDVCQRGGAGGAGGEAGVTLAVHAASPRFPSPAVDRQPHGIARRRLLQPAPARRPPPGPSPCPVGLGLSHSSPVIGRAALLQDKCFVMSTTKTTRAGDSQEIITRQLEKEELLSGSSNQQPGTDTGASHWLAGPSVLQ